MKIFKLVYPIDDAGNLRTFYGRGEECASILKDWLKNVVETMPEEKSNKIINDFLMAPDTNPLKFDTWSTEKVYEDNGLEDYIEREMSDVENSILERANDNGFPNTEDLFSINIDSKEFDDWSEDDMENHNWDLSKWQTLKELRSEIL